VMVPFFAHRNITYMKKVRQKALFEVSHESGASPSDADWENKVYRLFSAFDTDDSGDIDSKEMREMVTEMYSFLPKRVVRDVLLKLKVYCDADGHLDLPNLIDAVYAMQDYVDSFTEEDRAAWKEGVRKDKGWARSTQGGIGSIAQDAVANAMTTISRKLSVMPNAVNAAAIAEDQAEVTVMPNAVKAAAIAEDQAEETEDPPKNSKMAVAAELDAASGRVPTGAYSSNQIQTELVEVSRKASPAPLSVSPAALPSLESPRIFHKDIFF